MSEKVKDTEKVEGQQNIWSETLQPAKTVQQKEEILRRIIHHRVW